MADAPTPEQLNARLAKSPFNAWLKLAVTKIDADSIEMTAGWREEWVVNAERGYTHGGILAALVDVVADYAIAAKNGMPVPTIDLRVDYHRAAKGDMRCVGKLVRLGSQFTTAEAYVYDASGALCASGRGTYFTAPPAPPAAKPAA
jgi:uncharacterized protein (TIGR00369 family)